MAYTYYQGEQALFTFSVTDSAGDPMAVTGYTVSFAVTLRGESTAALTLNTTANAGQFGLDSPATGTITVTLSGTDTDGLGPGRYETLVKIDDGSGGVEIEPGQDIVIVDSVL